MIYKVQMRHLVVWCLKKKNPPHPATASSAQLSQRHRVIRNTVHFDEKKKQLPPKGAERIISPGFLRWKSKQGKLIYVLSNNTLKKKSSSSSSSINLHFGFVHLNKSLDASTQIFVHFGTKGFLNTTPKEAPTSSRIH